MTVWYWISLVKSASRQAGRETPSPRIWYSWLGAIFTDNAAQTAGRRGALGVGQAHSTRSSVQGSAQTETRGQASRSPRAQSPLRFSSSETIRLLTFGASYTAPLASILPTCRVSARRRPKSSSQKSDRI